MNICCTPALSGNASAVNTQRFQVWSYSSRGSKIPWAL